LARLAVNEGPMVTERDSLPRKLAAILHADIVGFSRLTEQDEDATLRGLRERLAIFTRFTSQHGGRVVGHPGDAVLAVFGSALDALSCAARIQAALVDSNSALPEDRRIRYRIGINLGDVITRHGDVYGDGVNIAARLQALAEPDGICISGSVYDAVGQRLPLDYESLGEQTVKNIEKPVRACQGPPETGFGSFRFLGAGPLRARGSAFYRPRACRGGPGGRGDRPFSLAAVDFGASAARGCGARAGYKGIAEGGGAALRQPQ